MPNKACGATTRRRVSYSKAPVVPIFYAYRKPGRLRKLLHLHAPITVVIGQPIRPDVSLGVKPAADRMRDEAETFMKQAYEQYAELS